MPAISFSAKEILPALLSKTKVQTIRPLKILSEYPIVYSYPRLKVGDRVKLYWKMRSKEKWFCSLCGGAAIGTHVCSIQGIMPETFPKLLGEAEITEVFEIDMHKTYFSYKGLSQTDEYDLLQFAKKDGFTSAQEMFTWFNTQYDLSTPKRFVVYRFKWV